MVKYTDGTYLLKGDERVFNVRISENLKAIINSKTNNVVWHKNRRRHEYIDKKVFKIVAPNPYIYWYLLNGGLFSKNKMPRGKRFASEVKKWNNGKYINGVWHGK